MEDAVCDSPGEFIPPTGQSRRGGFAHKLSQPNSVEASPVFCRVRRRQCSHSGSGKVRERTGRKAREMIFIRRFCVDSLGTLPMVACGRAKIDWGRRRSWRRGDLQFAVQIKLSDQRQGQLWKLHLMGRLINLGADAAKNGAYLFLRLDVPNERGGVGTVATVAIFSRAPGLRRIGDDHALWTINFRKTSPDAGAAG